jgi:carotenoid 1,2-hydratase
MNPCFDRSVDPGGYAWWYLDAWSDDGRQGLALIAFVGSVFSPYYAVARRRAGGRADPLQHCAINLAIYSASDAAMPRAWCMTERGAGQVQRSASVLRIGPSQLQWHGTHLEICIDEVAAPLPQRLRGTITVRAPEWLQQGYPLDDAGRHRWRPVAPRNRVEVRLSRPGVHWQGDGYLDANDGDRPLVEDFARWDWCRAPLADGASTVLYDVQHRSGAERRLALVFAPGDPVREVDPPAREALPRTGWRLARRAGCDAPDSPALLQTLEDGPFYARSRIRARLQGQDVDAMHESLCMDRWRRPLVQAMLPFRMPRRA